MPVDSQMTPALARRRGATLVELMTCVVVVGVAAGLAVEAGGAWAPDAAAAAGAALAGDLRYARARAVSTGRRHTLVVDAGAGTLTLTDAGGGDVPDPRRPGRAGPFVRRFAAEHPGCELQTPLRAGDGEPRPSLAFLPDGSVADPADPADKRDVALWLTAPGAGPAAPPLAVRVRAAGLTGQIWTAGPRPQNATTPAWLIEGEPALGTP